MITARIGLSPFYLSKATHDQATAAQTVASLLATIETLIGDHSSRPCDDRRRTSPQAVTESRSDCPGIPKPSRQIYNPHPTILFVLHDPSPFGAQLFIVRFIQWLQNHNPELGIECLVATRRDSDRRPEGVPASIDKALSLIGPVFFLGPNQVPENSDRIKNGYYSLIYLNSLASIGNLRTIPRTKTPLLLHVHELSLAANDILDRNMWDQIRAHEFSIVACSDQVKTMLIREFAIRESRISTVYSFVPEIESAAGAALSGEPKRGERLAQVLISGTVSWRKGGHLLGAIAQRLILHHGLSVHFTWLGHIVETDCAAAIQREFHKLGLSDAIQLRGHQEDTSRHLSETDVLLLPSMEDPFPLVMIEAAMHSIPIVAFENSGGAATFIRDEEGGMLAPYLDVATIADHLHRILSEPSLRQRLGRNAKRSAGKFSERTIAPQLRELILENFQRP